jgi:hypothetical protein
MTSPNPARPRQVTVTYYDSDKAPCTCIADGVAIATVAGVEQRNLTIASEKAPASAMAVVVVRHRESGAAIKYTVADNSLAKLIEINKTLDPRWRFDAVMQTDGLFDVSTQSH